MNKNDIIGNAIDELSRAIDRLKELTGYNESTLTDDDLLINDMETSIERLTELL